MPQPHQLPSRPPGAAAHRRRPLMLAELGGRGIDLARALHRQAMRAAAEVPEHRHGTPPPPPLPTRRCAARGRKRRPPVPRPRTGSPKTATPRRNGAARAGPQGGRREGCHRRRKRQIRNSIRPRLKGGCVVLEAQRLPRAREEGSTTTPRTRPAPARRSRRPYLPRPLARPGRLPALAGADGPDLMARPPGRGRACEVRIDRGRSDRGRRESPAVTRPQGRWAPLPPHASTKLSRFPYTNVGPLPSRGAAGAPRRHRPPSGPSYVHAIAVPPAVTPPPPPRGRPRGAKCGPAAPRRSGDA